MIHTNDKFRAINKGDIFLPPNLMSVGRILLTIPLGYCLASRSESAPTLCLILLILAGVTDYLDGFLARILNQKTILGLYLDPLADKVMSIIILIELIFTRSFPIWIAAAAIGRDFIILSGGLFMKRNKSFMPYSILTGKYYFASLAVLAGSYIIKYDFGIRLITATTIVLMILSFYFYIVRFIKVIKGREVSDFADRPLYVYVRTALTAIISIVYLYGLFF